MNQNLRYLYHFLISCGVDLKRVIYSFRGIPYYLKDWKKLKKQQDHAYKIIPFQQANPCLADRFMESGVAKGQYFYQDWFVAHRIFLNNPKVHVDIGSRVDGFVAHVASFRVIHVMDLRPLKTDVPNIKFLQADLMLPVNETLVRSCDSLSCLHSLEHFGLGRYGDSVNYDGYLVGLNNMSQLLVPNGKFYFSAPIGPLRIEFNAHRVFSIEYLFQLFEGKFRIDKFSFVDDEGEWHPDVPLKKDDVTLNFGCTYGCGIFEMTKL